MLKVYIEYGKAFKRNNDVKTHHYLVAVVVITMSRFFVRIVSIEIRLKRTAKETTDSIDDKPFK